MDGRLTGAGAGWAPSAAARGWDAPAAQPVWASATPTVLGPYRLVQVIGGGGMGVVHLALDPAGRAVAVKVLRPHVAAEPTARARLAREVDALRRVRSPRVAEVLDADPDAEQPYVVTQFVPAPSLEACVDNLGPMGGAALGRLGLGLGDALAAIHSAGVVHRDLKPANVLVLDGDPVVIDFGIAQIAEDVRLTSTGLVMGTPGYLAPEVLDGGQVNPTADWWGWAAVMAYAATGRPPFGTGPTEAVLSRVRRGLVDLDGVPAVLAAALGPALAPRPVDRPAPRRLREAVQALAPDAVVRAGGRAPEPPHQVTVAPERVTAALPSATAHLPSATMHLPVPTEHVPAPTEHLPAATAALPARPAPEAVPAGPAFAAPTQALARPESYARPEVAVRPDVGVGTAGELAEEGPGPEGDAVERSAVRSGTLAAALAALVAAAAVVPLVVAMVGVGAAVVARATDRSMAAQARRRYERGPRRSDGALTALGLPGHLLAALLTTIPLLLLPVAMAVSAALLVGWVVGARGIPAPGQSLPLAAGALTGLMTLWWGPGGAALRRGARSTVRALTPGRRGPQVAVVLLLLVAAAAVLVVATSGAGPDWTPLRSQPLG